MTVIQFDDARRKRTIDIAVEHEKNRLAFERKKNDALIMVDDAMKQAVADLWKTGIGVVNANDIVIGHVTERAGLYYSEFRKAILQDSENVDRDRE